MGLFDLLNKLKSGVEKQINPAYAQNTDFLEAAIAASALVAAADGTIDQGEREEAINLLVSHKTLGALYGASKIRDTAAAMCQLLARRTPPVLLCNDNLLSWQSLLRETRRPYRTLLPPDDFPCLLFDG